MNKLETELNYIVGHEAVLLARLEADALQEEDYAMLRYYEKRRKKLVDLKQYQEHREGREPRPYKKCNIGLIRRLSDRGAI